MGYWRHGARRGNRNCVNNSEVVIGRILIPLCVARPHRFTDSIGEGIEAETSYAVFDDRSEDGESSP